MKFEESRLSVIDARDPESLYKLIVGDLCGERYYRQFDDKIGSQVRAFIATVDIAGLNYEQFNELLLLFDQDRVGRTFFEFFFDPNGCVKLDALPAHIATFRGFAMLCFGDFRFAYKKLSQHDRTQLGPVLDPYSKSKDSIVSNFAKRPVPALRIQKIAKDKTWCLGYIAKGVYETEAKIVSEMIRKNPDDSNLLKRAEFYEQMGDAIRNTEAQGLGNTDIYLTWDYMDVYIATSMRKRWEFEETAEFVSELFGNATIRNLNLRYFDPTQSQCSYRIDKGLVEALMLKRARCTVYMVQESDTMGKDSELASTLAQGKPVIAYVPRIVDTESHARKLHQYPLDFFKLRCQVLQAEGALENPKLVPKLTAIEPEFDKLISDFIQSFVAYREKQPFSLWTEKEDEFRAASSAFGLICRILATAEQFNFDRRADTLRGIHPLSLQVHLESGVANGVLVVRSVEECADVLNRLLTNSLEFLIEFSKKEGCTLLKEKTSESPFRAVSNYEKLANSFWNFYLLEEPKS
jgi:hypothetical protein